MPRLLWLMFQVPMSSPQMTRMLGFLAAWARASLGIAASPTAHRSASPHAAQRSRVMRWVIDGPPRLRGSLLERKDDLPVLLHVHHGPAAPGRLVGRFVEPAHRGFPVVRPLGRGVSVANARPAPR